MYICSHFQSLVTNLACFQHWLQCFICIVLHTCSRTYIIMYVATYVVIRISVMYIV